MPPEIKPSFSITQKLARDQEDEIQGVSQVRTFPTHDLDFWNRTWTFGRKRRQISGKVYKTMRLEKCPCSDLFLVQGLPCRPQNGVHVLTISKMFLAFVVFSNTIFTMCPASSFLLLFFSGVLLLFSCLLLSRVHKTQPTTQRPHATHSALQSTPQQ